MGTDLSQAIAACTTSQRFGTERSIPAGEAKDSEAKEIHFYHWSLIASCTNFESNGRPTGERSGLRRWESAQPDRYPLSWSQTGQLLSAGGERRSNVLLTADPGPMSDKERRRYVAGAERVARQ